MNLFASFFEALLLIFVVSLFFLVGSDLPEQVPVRAGYGGALLFLGFLLWLGRRPFTQPFFSRKNPAAFLLLVLIGFELLRAAWFIGTGHGGSRAYVSGALFKWLFFGGFFMLGFLLFQTRRRRIFRFLWVVSSSAFFLALNAIPAILTKGLHAKGEYGYSFSLGEKVFFHPLFYFHPLLKKYVFASVTHPNYAGDVIALGFFPALAILFYSLKRWLEEKTGLERGQQVSAASLGLSLIFALTIAAASILFLSRGTTSSFLAVSSLYFFAVFLKFPSRAQGLIGGGVFVLLLGFLFWAVNLSQVGKGLATVKGEVSSTREGQSFSINREGKRRALAIYRDHLFWGAGTGGYELISKNYELPGTKGAPFKGTLANLRAMCHYLQILAEEGVGAYLYFLFLAAYIFEIAGGLIRTKSRFRFLAGLSLGASVFLLLAHGGVHYLLEQFSIFTLMALFMGASLGVLGVKS